MGESTRPLPPLIPLSNGGWEARSYLTSREYMIRGLGLLPSNSVIPVIVVPGIMGTNLRARSKPRLGRIKDERNGMAAQGAIVWRPPNGKQDGLAAARYWNRFSAIDRQNLLDGTTLEVDDSGPIVLPDQQDGYVVTEDEVRQRGWGEAHADSYGELLYALQTRLNQTFGYDDQRGERFVNDHWKAVMACDPKKWGLRQFERLTDDQLEKHARNYFPVYCVGYNWLEDCQISSKRLENKIREIIDSWVQTRRKCKQVILVTHSMGGLVARACAKRIPDKIAGVIHGVMPALGAPAAYRRIACGTESSSPSNSPLENLSASKIAQILGDTTEKTTAVLATSAGALELLPNHLYPQPWLHVKVMTAVGAAVGMLAKDDIPRVRLEQHEYLHLPSAKMANPYDLYRDMTSWYRLINPSLADPSGRYRTQPGGIEKAIKEAIDAAERFHRSLGDYYHPNSYAFYGDDSHYLSYGQMRWTARQPPGSAAALTPGNIGSAKFVRHDRDGQRHVVVEGKTALRFELEQQDSRGDGTVPQQSGAGPGGQVKTVFPMQGFDHQGSYGNEHILMLTLRLIVKIVQEIS